MNLQPASLPTLPRAEDCTLCGFCVQVCPVRALAIRESESETLLILDAPACIGCSKCERICDTKALTLHTSYSMQPCPERSRRDETRNIALRQSPRAACPACGKPTVSQAELDFVASKLGSPEWLPLCLDCRATNYISLM